MKIVDMMEKVFQMRTFKDRINVINKSFPNFWGCSAVVVAVRYKPAYRFLLWLKMLGLPWQRHQFIGKTEN